MKKIFFFFYSLISITITPQALKNDWENDELKGKVSKITIIYQFPQVSEGEIIPQNYNSGFFSKQYETLYNKQGKKIEKNIYDSDGILQNKESYYNNEENLNIPIPPPQNKKTENISKKDRQKKKFDKKGRIIKDIFYNENNKYNTIFNYKYDNSNNLIQREIIMYHSDGKILGKAIKIFDNKGNIIETINYGQNNQLIYKSLSKYKYDDKENWIEQILYDNTKKEPIRIIKRNIEYYSK